MTYLFFKRRHSWQTVFAKFGLISLFFGALTPLPCFAAPPGGPVVEFIQNLGNEALTSLTARNLPQDKRSRRVRDLLVKDFDIHAIGRFVLGTHWNEATESQRQEYFSLFENMIVQTYTRRFEDYSGQSFVVKGLISPGNGERNSMVSTVIVQPDGPPVTADWRVRDENGTLKVVDVVVDNVSMSITQRADFNSIMTGGGGINALLASLRSRTQMVN